MQLRNAMRREFLARADARKQQQLRRAEGPAGDDDFPRGIEDRPAFGAEYFDPGAPLSGERQPRGVGAREDFQVLSRFGAAQIRLRCAPALARLLRHLVHPDAFLFDAVEVRIAAKACLHARLDEGVRDRVRRARIGDVERPAGAVEVVRTAFVVLHALEYRQQVLPAPAWIAERRPVVVVLRMAADVDHRVDRTRSAEHLAARLVAAPAVQAGLRHGLESPVVDARGQDHRRAERHVDELRIVALARFDEADPDGRIFGQARGDCAARGPAAHHNVIELHCLLPVSYR